MAQRLKNFGTFWESLAISTRECIKRGERFRQVVGPELIPQPAFWAGSYLAPRTLFVLIRLLRFSRGRKMRPRGYGFRLKSAQRFPQNTGRDVQNRF